jgi:hypothetical protein
MMTCESPRAGAEQTVSVEVSNNGADVTSSGVQFVYERAPTVMKVRMVDSIITRGGRPELSVQGKYFSKLPEFRCSTGPASKYMSSSLVHCHIDSKSLASNLTVEVSNNGMDYSKYGIIWVSLADLGQSIHLLVPSFGPMIGGNIITVVGSTWENETIQHCVFGDTKSIASTLSNSKIICKTPPMTRLSKMIEKDLQKHEYKVRFAIQVNPNDRYTQPARDGGETYDAGGPVLFEYVTGGVVSGMVPSEGPVGGGTRVQVVGEHFKAGRETGCLFGRGGAYAVGRWESSSLVHCTSPMRGTEGVVRVLAVTDGVEMCGEEDGGRYVYREWPRVVRVDPEEGRAGEETVVRVGMAGGGALLEVGGRAECRVGGKERIEGRVTTATSVECRLPGRSHGNVTVEVSLNGADWGGDSVQFRYKGVCVMRSVVPSMGTEEGGTIVTVHGRGFKEGGRVWCRFGEEGGERWRQMSCRTERCDVRRRGAEVLMAWEYVQ